MRRDLVRELGCEPRTFRTVKGAMLWFGQYDESQYKLEMPLMPSAPASQQKRNRDRNTYALLLLSLTPQAPEVDSFTLHYVWMLPDWFRAWASQREMARDCGFPSLYALRQTMRFTEAILRERLLAKGLLDAGG